MSAQLARSLKRFKEPHPIAGVRTELAIKRACKRLKKLWLKHPDRKLSELVLCEVMQGNDEAFLNLVEAFWRD